MSDPRAGLGPAIVALLALGAVVHAELRPAERPSDPAREHHPHATPGALALLGGLAVGERIAGWEVLGIDGPRHEVLRIDLGRDRQRFAIVVARLGTLPERPPVQTDQYAIYYGHAHPPGSSIPDGAVRAITHAFARRIGATEHEVPVPAGL
jgi:hypothetical protein